MLSQTFSNFSEQWNTLTPVPDPLPPASVTVDGQTYTQPMLFKTLPGSPTGTTLLAAARVKSGTPSIIFSLHFVVNASTPPGVYPISISPIIVNNVDAGYSELGETVPILVGTLENQSDPGQAFAAFSPTIINGAILVEAIIIDSDSDGIPDSWETDHFGNLATADQTTDYDKDGYTDLQEYLNSTAEEADPLGRAYDPKVKNAPGGTGYIAISNSSFWMIVMPALLQGNT